MRDYRRERRTKEGSQRDVDDDQLRVVNTLTLVRINEISLELELAATLDWYVEIAYPDGHKARLGDKLALTDRHVVRKRRELGGSEDIYRCDLLLRLSDGYVHLAKFDLTETDFRVLDAADFSILTDTSFPTQDGSIKDVVNLMGYYHTTCILDLCQVLDQLYQAKAAAFMKELSEL